jgi:hypothetical protein
VHIRTFRHAIITRFNVQLGFASDTPRLEPAWIAPRWHLFENFCYPSVATQSVKPDSWLMFVDAATPPEYRERLAQLPLVEPIYISNALTDAIIARNVCERLSLDCTHLITSRLDSDDAIAADFIAKVQESFDYQDLCFVNFPLGYHWTDGRLYNTWDLSSPFISMIERAGSLRGEDLPFRTVHCVPHHRASDIARVHQLRVGPRWLQVVHDRNSLTSLKGLRRIRRRAPAEFSLDGPARLREESLSRRLVGLGASMGQMGRFAASGAVRRLGHHR